MEFKHGHKYTKEDALTLVLLLEEGEKSSKELYQALEEKGLYQKTKSDSAKSQRISSLKKFARSVLGEGAIQEIKKPLSGTGRGGCRQLSYFALMISSGEALNRIEVYKPTRSGGRKKDASIEETKEQKEEVIEQVSAQPESLNAQKAALLGITRELMNFFGDIQNYSPRQFEDLLKRVSASGFSSQSVIEVVISSFREAEHSRMEEIEKRYLA